MADLVLCDMTMCKHWDWWERFTVLWGQFIDKQNATISSKTMKAG